MSSRPAPTNAPPSTSSDRAERIARLLPQIGQPQSRAEAATRLCEAIRDLARAAAVALLLDDGVLEGVLNRAALSGFTLTPPDGLPASLEPVELERLARWGERLGIGPVEFAFIVHDDLRLGVVALFGVRGEPLGDNQLELLGAVVGYALEHARIVEDLRRAYETQERTRDQVVRTERLRVLGEMALGVAHDFNNVLNAMLGQVGVLEVLADRDPELAAPIERLKHVALEGAATVERLQDFTRQRRDREFDRIDMSQLVTTALAELRSGGAAGTCAIIERIEPGVLVFGNAAELKHALDAVFDNAIGARSSHITVTLRRGDDEVRLTIADDGCGMSREVRKRAFDPYFTTKGSLSSGLGLSVAYGIVRRHAGRIELESTPGQGTKVKIRIATSIATATESARTGGDVGPAIGGARILLVEDDEDNREAMATLLGLVGHIVTAASSGADGLRQFSAARFDLVLTDLGLPDMTGWEVARQIKEISAETPVALITGWAMTLAPDEIRRKGVDLLIKKPIIEPRKFLASLGTLGRRL